MLDSLRIIMGETFEVYKLATLDGIHIMASEYQKIKSCLMTHTY